MGKTDCLNTYRPPIAQVTFGLDSERHVGYSGKCGGIRKCPCFLLANSMPFPEHHYKTARCRKLVSIPRKTRNPLIAIDPEDIS